MNKDDFYLINLPIEGLNYILICGSQNTNFIDLHTHTPKSTKRIEPSTVRINMDLYPLNWYETLKQIHTNVLKHNY